MFIGVLTVKLHIPWSHSLKEKRQVLKSLCAKVRQKYNVAAAEVGSQELWQMAELCFVTVAAASQPGERLLADLERFIEASTDTVIVEMTRQWR